jgi:hypothetical protein
MEIKKQQFIVGESKYFDFISHWTEILPLCSHLHANNCINKEEKSNHDTNIRQRLKRKHSLVKVKITERSSEILTSESEVSCINYILG